MLGALDSSLPQFVSSLSTEAWPHKYLKRTAPGDGIVRDRNLPRGRKEIPVLRRRPVPDARQST